VRTGIRFPNLTRRPWRAAFPAAETGSQRPPETSQPFAGGLTGPLVADEVVERVPVVRNLHPPVRAASGAEQCASGTGLRTGLAAV
jgi:hypothetical protein